MHGSIECEREEVLPEKNKCGEWVWRKQPFKELPLSISEYGDSHRSQQKERTKDMPGAILWLFNLVRICIYFASRQCVFLLSSNRHLQRDSVLNILGWLSEFRALSSELPCAVLLKMNCFAWTWSYVPCSWNQRFFTMLVLTIERINLNFIGLSESLIIFWVTSYLKDKLLMK